LARTGRLAETYDAWLQGLSGRLEGHAVGLLYLSLGAVFFYFGLQKPLPVSSPVAGELTYLAHTIGVAPYAVINFVGLYEMTLGILFFLRAFRPAFALFVVHQTVTFLSLIVLAYSAFQPPWMNVFGFQVPWVLAGYGAFVGKNLVFVAAVLLLLTLEYGE